MKSFKATDCRLIMSPSLIEKEGDEKKPLLAMLHLCKRSGATKLLIHRLGYLPLFKVAKSLIFQKSMSVERNGPLSL